MHEDLFAVGIEVSLDYLLGGGSRMYSKGLPEKAAECFTVAAGGLSWMLQELQIKAEYVSRYDTLCRCARSAFLLQSQQP